MSKAVTTTKVLTSDQVKRVDRAKTYHSSCLKAFGDQMGYAFLAGMELNALREQIEEAFGYGHFTKLREEHLPEIPNGSAYRYMDFQKKLVASFPTVGKVALLTNGEANLSDSDREKVLKAVHEFADGKTLTQFYRDLGVVKSAAPLGRRIGEGGRKKLSLAQQAELLQLQAVEDWSALDRSLMAYGAKFTVLTDEDAQAQIASLEQALMARKAWLKQPRNKRDPRAIQELLT